MSARTAFDRLAASGRRQPGGCLECCAFTTVRRDAPGMFVATVHHDQTCPALARKTARKRP